MLPCPAHKKEGVQDFFNPQTVKSKGEEK